MSMEAINEKLKTNNEEHKAMSQKIDNLGEDLTEIKITLAGLPERLAEKFDQRYAYKEYEDAIKKLNWLVISAVVIALLGLIIKVV